MAKLLKIFITALLMCTALMLFPQDSTQVATRDSSIAAQLEKTTELITKSDSIKRADSLEAESIAAQISKLRANDLIRKASLQARLDSLTEAKAVREQKIKSQVDSLRAENFGVPVVFYKDTLFEIFAKLGPFAPSQRAASISQKLLSLAEMDNFDPDKLHVFEGIESDDLMYDDMIILSITDRDAFWKGMDRGVVAHEYLNLIRDREITYNKQNSLANTIWRFILLAIVILAFGLGIWLMNRGFSFINRRVMARSTRFLNGVKIKDYELLGADKEKNLIRYVLKIAKWILIIFIVYLALPAIFSIFPATEAIASTLIGYVISPLRRSALSFLNYIPSLISIIVIVAIARYVVKFLAFMASEIRMGNLVINGFYPEYATPTLNIFKLLTYAFTFIIIFPYLPGSESPAFQGVSVFLGLLISLGSSSAISNIIAGLVITYMRAFKIGDRVQIGDVTGDVLAKTLLVTRLRTIKNEDVSIPNSAILNGSTTNFSSSARQMGLILHSTVTIGYDVPWRQVHELLMDAAVKTEYVEKNPLPFVLQTSLDDFYVSYQINLYTYQAGLAAKIYSQLHSHIQDNFNAAGIEIMSPHYRAARDGNMTTVPGENLGKDYVAPKWRVGNDFL